MLLKHIMLDATMVVNVNLNDRHFLEELGYRIREWRVAKGMTQAELADACELHRTFIGSVERGERNIAILNLRRIARALSVKLTDLLVDAK